MAAPFHDAWHSTTKAREISHLAIIAERRSHLCQKMEMMWTGSKKQ